MEWSRDSRNDSLRAGSERLARLRPCIWPTAYDIWRGRTGRSICARLESLPHATKINWLLVHVPVTDSNVGETRFGSCMTTATKDSHDTASDERGLSPNLWPINIEVFDECFTFHGASLRKLVCWLNLDKVDRRKLFYLRLARLHRSKCKMLYNSTILPQARLQRFSNVK